MAFNFDHTANGDLTFKGAHVAFTGNFIFPLPSQSRPSHVLMTDNASFDIESIYGLSGELSLKANTSDLGQAAFLNTTDLPVLVDRGDGSAVLNDAVLPASVCNDFCVVQTEVGLTVLTTAKKGDFATVVSNSKTYILTGSSVANDWIALRSEDADVTSVQGSIGDVTVDACNIGTCYSQFTHANDVINDLYDNKVNNTDLNNYLDFNGLTNGITSACIIGLGDLTSIYFCSSCYLTTNWMTDCGFSSTYETSTATDGKLSCKIQTSSIENKAGWYTYSIESTPGAAQIVVVTANGSICSDFIPSYAITDTIPISSETDLGTLSPEKGDVAISASECKSWIWDGAAWQLIASNGNLLFYVNSKYANPDNTVTIATEDFADINSSISSTLGSVTSTEANYQGASAFALCLTSTYITTGDFSQALAARADLVHQHLSCEVTDLQISFGGFVTGSCYSVMSDPLSTSCGQSNVLFGQSASDNGLNCAIVHSAGSFATNGDAQAIQFKLKSSSSNTLGDVVLGDGLDLISADVVGYTSAGDYVSYRIEKLFSTSAGATSAVGDDAVTTFAESIGGVSNASNPSFTVSNNCVQVSIDTLGAVTFDYLMADVNIVHVG
jgi:hypothetical protein